MRSVQFLTVVLLASVGVSSAGAQERFELDNVLGDWYGPDGGKAFTIERAHPMKLKSEALSLRGKYGDWIGAMNSRGAVSFARTPTAEQIDPAAPEWARTLVANSGKLQWRLTLNLRRGCSELVLDGDFYPGELHWGNQPKEQAEVKGSGDPRPVRYTKFETDPDMRHEPQGVDISALDIIDLGRKARQPQSNGLRGRIGVMEADLASTDELVSKSEREYASALEAERKAGDALAEATRNRQAASEWLARLTPPPELQQKKDEKEKEWEDVRSKLFALGSDPNYRKSPTYKTLYDRSYKLSEELAQIDLAQKSRPEVQTAMRDLSRTDAAVRTATGARAASAANASAASGKLISARTGRSKEIEDLRNAYEKLDEMRSNGFIYGVTINESDGKTLVKADYAHWEEIFDDIGELRQTLDDAKSAMEVAKVAKDKVFADFKSETDIALADGKRLEEMIRANDKKKAQSKMTESGLKAFRGYVKGGLPGFAVEVLQQVCERAFEKALEHDMPVGPDPSLIEKQVLEAYKAATPQEETLGELAGVAIEHSVRFTLTNAGAATTVGAGAVATEQIVDALKDLKEKSVFLAKVSENYAHFTKEALQVSLKDKAVDFGLSVGVEYYGHILDEEEAELWRDYYLHDKMAMQAWRFRSVTDQQYWEAAGYYDNLQEQIIQRLREGNSEEIPYQIDAAKFPAHTHECSQLDIIVTPSHAGNRDSVRFNNLAAVRVNGDDADDHRYRFKVPIIEEGGARELRVQVSVGKR